MHKKDYLVRQFEEFGKALALILGFKKEKDWEKFEKEIADAAKKFTLLEMDRVENLPDDAFKNQVMMNENITHEQKIILAGLLFEKMNYYIAFEDHKKYAIIKNRCLGLYKNIRDNFTENEFNLDVHYKIEFLNKM